MKTQRIICLVAVTGVALASGCARDRGDVLSETKNQVAAVEAEDPYRVMTEEPIAGLCRKAFGGADWQGYVPNQREAIRHTLLRLWRFYSGMDTEPTVTECDEMGDHFGAKVPRLDLSAELRDLKFSLNVLIKVYPPVALLMANAGLANERLEQMADNISAAASSGSMRGRGWESRPKLMDLSGNRITSLTPVVGGTMNGSFQRPIGVETLYAGRNLVEKVDTPTVEESSFKVSMLDISDNPLTKQVILPKLVWLDMSRTKVKKFVTGASYRHLTMLYLDGLTELTLKIGAPSGPDSLIYLSARDTSFKGLEIDGGRDSLSFLNLSGATGLHGNALGGLSALDGLDGLDVSHSDAAALATIPSLRVLSVAGSAVTDLSGVASGANLALVDARSAEASGAESIAVKGGQTSFATLASCKVFDDVAMGSCQTQYGVCRDGALEQKVVTSNAIDVYRVECTGSIEMPWGVEQQPSFDWERHQLPIF
jgi:hypothetical protein